VPRDRSVTLPEMSAQIGAKLKHGRLLMGISLTELGKRVDLSEGFLSKLENGHSQASLATLHKLMQALGTNISDLFVPSSDRAGPVQVVRSTDRPRLETGHRRAGNYVALERLVASGPGQLLQVNIHVVAPGGGSSEAISHPGQEFGYVLSGAIELTVAGQSNVIGEGDSFSFDSSLPHAYRNPGDTEARILWVNTPPTF